MSRFVKSRNHSLDYHEDSLKKEFKPLISRVSGEITMSSKILDATPLSFYNEQLPPCLTTGKRFFQHKKSAESPSCKNPQRSVQVSRLIHSSQDSHRPNTAPACWEISERIETCEIRCKMNPDFSPNQKILLWKNCCNEVIPAVKKENIEIGANIARLTQGIFEVVGDANETWNETIRKKVEEIQKLCEIIENLKNTVNKLQGDIEKYENIEYKENLQIQEEINELFGEDQDEIVELKQRVRKLLEIRPSGVVGLLREVYAELNKDRYIPEERDTDLECPEPYDITAALKFDYKRIINSTTRKAMALLRKEFTQHEKSTQTYENCVTGSEFDEISRKYEKNLLALQSAQLQIDKYREDYIARLQHAEKCEKEKNAANHEMLKFKRETEGFIKENLALKKELETVKNEKLKISKEFDAASKDLLKKEEKIKALEGKLKKISVRMTENRSMHEEKERSFTEVSEGSHQIHSNYYHPKKSPRGDTIAPSESRRPTRIISNPSNPNEIKSFYKASMINNSNYSSNSSFEEYKNNFQDIYPALRKNLKNETEIKDTNKPMITIIEDNNPHEQITSSNEPKANSVVTQASKKKKKVSIKEKNSGGKKKTVKQKTIEEETPKKSHAVVSTNFKEGNMEKGENTREILRDGKFIHLTDRACNTLTSIKAGVSVAIQYNWDQPDETDENNLKNSNFYLFNFNPNNVYGLAGDVFFNSRSKVFGAHPKLSELSTDIFSQLK